MLIFRKITSLRALRRLPNVNFKPAARNSGQWHYRKAGTPPSKAVVVAAEIVGGVAWWWVLWHLFTEPQVLTGEFAYPDPCQWTDEELGIPEDIIIEF